MLKSRSFKIFISCILLAAVVFVGLFAGNRVYAYLEDRDNAVNNTEIGEVDIGIEEGTVQSYSRPATRYTKDVNLRNNSEGPVYLRARVLASDSNIDPNGYIYASGWTYNSSDGYYYYNRPVEADTVVDFLESYKTASFTIDGETKLKTDNPEWIYSETDTKEDDALRYTMNGYIGNQIYSEETYTGSQIYVYAEGWEAEKTNELTGSAIITAANNNQIFQNK